VRRVPAADEKPLHWVGSSKRDFLSFPRPSRRTWETPSASRSSAEPRQRRSRGRDSVRACWRSVESHDGNAYRAVYTVRFEKAVYVLHAFQKKSPSGIRTAKRDVDLVAQRLRTAEKDHEEHYGKSKR
jgi:phage-related protein